VRNRSPSARGVTGAASALDRGRPERFRAGATLVLWLRADLGITIVTGVSQWNDQSGSANHVTQATGSKQPTVAAADINGKPALAFDGTDDVLSKASTTLITSSAYSIFMVNKLNANGGDTATLGITDASTGLFVRQFATGERGTTHALVADLKDAAATTSYERWAFVFSTGATPEFRVNGTAQSLSAGTTLITPAAGAALSIGARWNSAAFDIFSNCKVAEVIVYARALSTSEAARQGGYQRAWLGV
jgi:Concanavalin A-like lectin/glucanases superfamily